MSGVTHLRFSCMQEKQYRKQQLGVYERGRSAYRACAADPRFGYFLYFPDAFSPDTADEYAFCVVIHGSARTPYVYRDLFVDFAERHSLVILAPMFPVGITDPDDMGSYKFLVAGDLRYDRVLLAMVDEVEARFGVNGCRFLLHGFSGGGHFVHRFFYLHAARIRALSVGAPGMVTLLDQALDWHCGIRGMEDRFDARIAWEDMREVPVQLVVGEEDTETWEITIKPDSRHWMAGVNDAGRTRPERLQALRDSFEQAGIKVRYDVVPNVGHNGYDILDAVQSFFSGVLYDDQLSAERTNEQSISSD